MTATRKLVLLSVVAVSAFVVANVRSTSIASGAVPVPPNYVVAPGSQEAEKPTAAELDNVRR